MSGPKKKKKKNTVSEVTGSRLDIWML